MLTSDQSKIIEQAKFTYFPLRKALGKQLKQLIDKEENKLKVSKT